MRIRNQFRTMGIQKVILTNLSLMMCFLINGSLNVYFVSPHIFLNQCVLGAWAFPSNASIKRVRSTSYIFICQRREL